MTFTQALDAARSRSLERRNRGCVFYVNGRIARVPTTEGVAIEKNGFTVSDWYADGGTVCGFKNGEEFDPH